CQPALHAGRVHLVISALVRTGHSYPIELKNTRNYTVIGIQRRFSTMFPKRKIAVTSSLSGIAALS
ncbi:MAG: hypothetical protein KAT00_02520, partial [Planctomycetes bacterium]|nr:hypothetical protein [Planctomycetota bacterium]